MPAPGSARPETMNDIDVDRLIEEHGKKVYNTVYYLLGNPQDTEDAVQEVFYQVHRSLHKFRGNASISTWIYRIAMNVSIDFIRKKKRRPEIEGSMDLEERETIVGLPGRGASAEDEAMKREKLRELRSALQTLPEIYRTVFVLSAEEGYSHKEIAEILGIKAGTARIRFFRAVEMLRGEMAGTAV